VWLFTIGNHATEAIYLPPVQANDHGAEHSTRTSLSTVRLGHRVQS
jgi:hypothetical protein